MYLGANDSNIYVNGFNNHYNGSPALYYVDYGLLRVENIQLALFYNIRYVSLENFGSS